MTMADVAKLAGVSTITVSRALSGSGVVRAETRERVREIAKQHGYKLNTTARNLRQRSTRTVAVVVEMTPSANRRMNGSYPLELLGGMIHELTAANYSVMLSTRASLTDTTPTADAVVLLGQGSHEDAVAELDRFGLPLVVWGSVRNDGDHVIVGSDNVAGGCLAADRLCSIGRRTLVCLGDIEHAEVADRFDGFTGRVAELGATHVATRHCDFTFAGGHNAMAALLDTHGAAIDGVFASSDAVAMGAIRALTEYGRGVPDDVSVIGFDDAHDAAQFVPPLTTIRQHWHEGGSLLARKALALVQGEAVQSELMPVEIVIRAS